MRDTIAERNARIVELAQSGLTTAEISMRIGISQKAVARIARDGGVPSQRAPQRISVWNPETVEMMISLWKSGTSAANIASNIGHGTTRNAVIGKLHRMGLSAMRVQSPVNRSSSKRRNQKPHLTPRPTVPRPSVEPVDIPDDDYAPASERVKLLDLTNRSCRWPIGDPQHSDFAFCGKHKFHGLPYCEHHARKAYQPPASSRPSAPSSPPRNTGAATRESNVEEFVKG